MSRLFHDSTNRWNSALLSSTAIVERTYELWRGVASLGLLDPIEEALEHRAVALGLLGKGRVRTVLEHNPFGAGDTVGQYAHLDRRGLVVAPGSDERRHLDLAQPRADVPVAQMASSEE